MSQTETLTAVNNAIVLYKNGWIGSAADLCASANLGCHFEELQGLQPEAKKDLVEIVTLNPESIRNHKSAIGPHKPLVVLGNQVVGTLHFTSSLSEYQKRIAFKSAVRLIDLETSSQCNRRCEYCVNATYDETRDRFSKNIFMNDEIFASIIDPLAEIGFVGRIAFHYLNEPLMFVDSLVERIAFARQKLPNATLTVYTNGDFLTRPVLDRLAAAGVNAVEITAHLQRGQNYTESKILTRIFNKAKELGLAAVLSDYREGESIGFTLSGSSMAVRMILVNYMRYGHSRGNLLDGVGRQVEARTKPCKQPLDWFVVNYTGAVTACCDLVADSPAHRNFVTGQLSTSNIFDIYSGPAYVSWRKGTMMSGEKRDPCGACPSDIDREFMPGWDDLIAQAIDGAIAIERSAEPSAAPLEAAA
jgi:hypothetical protein